MARGHTERVRADIAALGAFDCHTKHFCRRGLAMTFDRKKASFLAATRHKGHITSASRSGTPAVEARISEKYLARSRPKYPDGTPYAPETDRHLKAHSQPGVRGAQGLGKLRAPTFRPNHFLMQKRCFYRGFHITTGLVMALGSCI